MHPIQVDEKHESLSKLMFSLRLASLGMQVKGGTLHFGNNNINLTSQNTS